MFYSFLYRAHLVQITIRLTILLTTFRQIYEQISTWVVVIRSVYARVENLTVLSPFSAACHSGSELHCVKLEFNSLVHSELLMTFEMDN